MYVYMSVCTLSLAGEPILIIASANTKTFVSHVTFSVHHLFLTLLNEKSLQAKMTNTKRSQWSFIFILETVTVKAIHPFVVQWWSYNKSQLITKPKDFSLHGL